MAHLRPTGQIREGDSPETWNPPPPPLLSFRGGRNRGEKASGRERVREKEGKTETGVKEKWYQVRVNIQIRVSKDE